MEKKYIKIICLLMLVLLCISAAEVSFAAENNSQSNPSISKKCQQLRAFYASNVTYTSEMEKYIDSLDSLSFAWSRLYYEDLGSLNITKGKNNNNWFYYPEDFIKPVQYAQSKGKSIQISVFMDEPNAEKILTSEENRVTAIQSILAGLSHDIGNGESISFDGVVVDIEGLQDKNSKGEDILFNNKHISTYFNSFLKELNIELDKMDKKLYVAVNPRLYYNGYDYTEILKIVDKMIVMVHDYEPSGLLRKNEVQQYFDYSVLNPIDSLAPIRKLKLALEDVKKSITDSAPD